MCIFSGAVESVSATKIFARMCQPAGPSIHEATKQCLVYQMTLSAGQPVAMILPLPVERVDGEVKEDALEFINLEEYPSFFADMESGFPQPRSRGFDDDSFSKSKSILQVHQVGAFVASFVPNIGDFDRLDPKFRLPAGAVSYPGYQDFSFAVFQIKPGRELDIHPMAFIFPNRDPNKLFFPTVHVHDGGTVKAEDEFDHSLYCQHAHGDFSAKTDRAAGHFMNISQTLGLVDSNRHICKRVIHGMHPNEDIVIDIAAA